MLHGGKQTIICAVALRVQMQSWKRAWRKVLKDTGLKYRWHDLRHTFLTQLAENPKISGGTVRAMAGHVSKQMLKRYSHIRANKKSDAIQALERDRLENSAR